MSGVHNIQSNVGNQPIQNIENKPIEENNVKLQNKENKQEPTFVPDKNDKNVEYFKRAENLIKTAQKFSHEKEKVQMFKVEHKDNGQVKYIKDQLKTIGATNEKALSELSKFKVSDFKDVFQIKGAFENLNKNQGDFKTDNQAYATLKNTMDSQKAYVSHLKALADTAGHSPALDKMILFEQKKYDEIGQFVMAIQEKTAQEQSLIVDNLPFLDTAQAKQKIEVVQNVIQDDLESLFKLLDCIPKGAIPEEAKYILDEIAGKIENVEGKLASMSANGAYIGEVKDENGNTGKVSISQDFINNIKDNLEDAKARITALKDPNSIKPEKNLIKSMFIQVPAEKFGSVIQGKSPLKKMLQEINTLHNVASDRAENQHPFPTSKELKKLMNKYDSFASSSNLKKLELLAKVEDFSLPQKDLNKILVICGFPPNSNLTPDQTGLIKELGVLVKDYIESIEDKKVTEFAEYDRLTARPTPEMRGEFVKFAFEHNLDIVSVVESSIRGVPLDSIETGTSKNMEVSALGSGMTNTVFKCTFLDADGNSSVKLFKPELQSRRGFNHMANYSMGYDNSLNVAQLNLATQDTANLLGNKKMIASTKVGTVNGAFGIFMDVAPGKPARSIKIDTSFGTDKNGKSITSQNMKSVLGPKLQSTQLSLKKELNDLEWVDALTGQADRHGGNFFINVDTEEGKVTVTGIDNDSSFSHALIGPAMIDPKKLPYSQRSELMSNIPDDAKIYDKNKNLVAVDMSKVNRKEQELLGLNSNISKPRFISKETFDNLMSLTPQAYEAQLKKNNMPESMISSALLRLENCQAHAKDLEAKGYVFDFNEPEKDPTLFVHMGDAELYFKGNMGL